MHESPKLQLPYTRMHGCVMPDNGRIGLELVTVKVGVSDAAN